MLIRFLFLSFAVHAAGLGHLANNSPSLFQSSSEEVSVQVISNPDPSRPFERIRKNRVAMVEHAIPVEKGPGNMDESRKNLPDSQAPHFVSLHSARVHPYLHSLWAVLLNKKNQIGFYQQQKSSYLVRLKISKNGVIDSIDVKGPEVVVAEAIHTSLARNPYVPPVPDDVSGSDFYVQYAVYF